MTDKRQGLTYRTKLILFFLSAVIITAFVGLYNYVSTRVLMQDITDLLNKSQEITTIYNEVEEIQQVLEDYLLTRSSKSLQKFYEYSNSISAHIGSLRKRAQYSQQGIKIINLIKMVDHYVGVLDETIIAKRNNKIEDYTLGYQEAVKEYKYIGAYIENIMTQDLINGTKKYIDIQKEIAHSSIINYLVFGTTMVLIIVIIVMFSFEITKPISRLAYYAEEISEGNFDIELPDEKTSSEITILYKTFGNMAVSIRKSINELKEKQVLESTLNEEKVKNLKMNSALHEAELKALQSQVNPHFIFNTINIGANIAMLQGDDITSNYLKDFADILRYNLKGLTFNATLQEEIQNVRSYMNLLITRFGDAIDFRIDIPQDVELLKFTLPRMTLQPIVENAYIHGLSKLDNGGVIELKVSRCEQNIIIDISNTGPEISKKNKDLILAEKFQRREDQSNRLGHITGIGINNVLSRLRLFYNTEAVMDISCCQGITHFILILPFEDKEKEGDDEIDV